MTTDTALNSSLLESRASVPQHVVYRSFPSETVALNLETGRYHGLSVTAGRMLDALTRSTSVRAASIELAASYEQPLAVVEQDLCDLCAALLERGLIDLEERSRVRAGVSSPLGVPRSP